MKRKVRNNSNSQSLHSMQVSRSPHYSLAAPNSARSSACSRVKSQNGPKKPKEDLGSSRGARQSENQFRSMYGTLLLTVHSGCGVKHGKSLAVYKTGCEPERFPKM